MTESGVGTALDAIRQSGSRSWLVGGAVRDRLLGRETGDYDVAVEGDVRRLARRVAAEVDAFSFELSHGFGAWRIVPRRGAGGPPWQLDLLPVLSGSIEADLAQRDLTVNALAQPLGQDDLIDPFGGLRDLDERRLRMVSADAFDRDPLRTLRLVRLSCELSFELEPATAAQARRSASGLERVSPERVFEEFKRILCAQNPGAGLGLMAELGITAVLLPELWSLRGVEQSRFHHLDVHDHTLSVLAETVALEHAPDRHLGRCAQAADEFLSAPLANGLTRWQTLRFGALLHDVAKPQTRAVTAEGRVTFMGHDVAGSETAGQILVRLRASSRLREHVAGLVRHHLRLGFLVHCAPLSRRDIYHYLKACRPVEVDVTVLSVADRLATRGDRAQDAIAAHLRLADELLCEALQWQAAPPRPPVRGDELAAALGVVPGPAIGVLLEELEEAAFAHEISSPEEAIARARELAAGPATPARDR
ncbi:MAG TPA: HD domain-containing protein [Solirubrobacteraceae bacterium]